MKGLIFKELYLARKRLFISLGIYFFLMLMCLLVKLSAVHGNIGLLDDEAVKHVEIVTFYLAVFGLLMAIAGFVVNNAESDKTTHWDIYRRTIPFTEKQIVGSVYLSNAISLGSSIAVHTLVSLIICSVFDMQFEPWFFFTFLSFGLFVYLINSFNLFCQYRFRDPKKSKLVYTAVCFSIYFGVCNALAFAMLLKAPKGDPAENEQFLKDTAKSFVSFLKNYAWILPVVCVVLIAVLFFASVRACARPADAGKPPKGKEEKPYKTFFGKLRATAEGDDN